MKTFTNLKTYGANFGTEIIANFKKYSCVEIASGYFGVSQLNIIRRDILDLAARGSCKIVIGMIYHEGVGQEQKRVLYELHQELRQINPRSGVYVSLRPYHGKVYRFYDQSEESVYVGSSNFSASGFYTNCEFNVKVDDLGCKAEVVGFLNHMFDGANKLVAPLDKVELLLKGTGQHSSATNSVNGALVDCCISRRRFPSLPVLSSTLIKLRVDQQPNSSLNLFFDKGRKTLDGKYTPRPWYEVEVTSLESERSRSSDYPRGEFLAYVEDNGLYYQIPMITASAGFKAITSRGNREILGEYIKGKLERLGFLEKYQRVTSEILMEYGVDSLTLEKIGNQKYYMKF